MATRADWMAGRWGLFSHFLAGRASGQEPVELGIDAWNERVDRFDVDGLAAQLADVGASWYGITLGQNTGYYCSPNPVYDELTGIAPSKCARRDLPAELAAALAPHGIRLLAYLPSHAPAHDHDAVRRLRCTPAWDPSRWSFKPGTYGPDDVAADERLSEFQRHWEAIIREWSTRWGRAVSGWWIDGCYYADRMYREADAPNFGSFAAALRAGNPDAAVCFNSGCVVHRVGSISEHEDYTAGEANTSLPLCTEPRVGSPEPHAQWHVLSLLGEHWGDGPPRLCDAMAVGYTRECCRRGGALTWDVPLNGDGRLPVAHLAQVRRLGEAG